MDLFLGVDGGGSGCRAALADGSGRILGRGAAGPANVRSDTEGTLTHILAALAGAVAEAKAAGHLAEDPDPARISALLGLAGANVTEAAERLAARLPFGRARVVSDGATALRGALGEADGILAAIGTGSVFARAYRGTVRQVGGRGFVLGDEASGAALGRELLADVLRADDGLIEQTPLLAEVLNEMGGDEAIISFSFRASPAEFAALAPRLIASADPAAEAILRRATETLRSILLALQPEGEQLPVVFTGGLGAVYGARLGPRVVQRPPKGSALDGAVALALQMGCASG